MPEYMEPFPSTTKVFDEAIAEIGLDTYINIVIVSDNKAKKIFVVKKATPIHKHRTDDDVIIVLNEFVFDKLSEAQRLIVIDDALSYIDFSDDKLSISSPDVIVNRLVVNKVGVDKYFDLQDTIKLIYSQEKDKKAQDDKK